MKIYTVTRKILLPMILGLLTLLSSIVVYAACTSPAGANGELLWHSGNLKFCRNTSWRVMVGTLIGGACSPNGKVQFVSSKLRFCKGGTWYHVSSDTLGNPGSTGTGSCPTETGKFYYHAARTMFVYCDGTDWHDFW